MSVLFPSSLFWVLGSVLLLGPSLTIVSEYNAILNLLSKTDFLKLVITIKLEDD